MKKFTIAIVLLFSIYGFSQIQSYGIVSPTFPTDPSQQFAGSEIFRFAPGIVTQLDLAGTTVANKPFDFSTSRWFALGRLNTGTQSVYGLRFQLPNKSLLLGYRDLADVNPRLEWIGTGAGLGNLEFRTANSFTSTTSNLVATMTNDGNTYFGDPSFSNTKVGIEYKTLTGLTLSTSVSATSFAPSIGIKLINDTSTYSKEAINIQSFNRDSGFRSYGINLNIAGSSESFGIVGNISSSAKSLGMQLTAKNGTITNVGVKGEVSNAGGFGAGIWGVAPTTNTNWYAGLFDGRVVVNGAFSAPSDKKLKVNIKDDKGLLEKLLKLNPVNYNYAANDKINLPGGLQHGFLAQDIEEFFPELVIPARKPITDKEGKFIEYYDYKTVNYLGIISLLTSGIKELDNKVKSLEAVVSKNMNNGSLDLIKNSTINTTEFILEQNIPNPFDNQTTISYGLPSGTNASLTIFDLTGKLIKDYALSNQKGEIVIQASDIGKGMFIYSLVINNQEMITKKMIVK